MRLENTAVVTYYSPSHERFQRHFYENYSHLFKQSLSTSQKGVLESQFYKDNINIFSYEKYFGYFLWKPYVILYGMQNMNYRYILYCDCNVRFKDFNSFADKFNYSMDFTHALDGNGKFFIGHKNFKNKEWTKRDAFYYMDADKPSYWEANQIWSSVMGFENTQGNIKFLQEYLEYCQDERILTELPNQCGLDNLPGFREHRWEQSIMSILVKKYNIPVVAWDTETINYVDKYYDTELLELKERVNRDPLKKVNHESI